ncbi:ABC transporter substrate-binding protein [Chloroflexota bacterium]
MNKHFWMILTIIVSGICFAVSLYYITHNDNKIEPEIVITTSPMANIVTWYTSIPLRHAESLANAFRTETGIDVEIVRDSTFTINERLISEIENGATEADVITIADIGIFIELKNNGHLMKYDSPHYLKYKEEYKDPGYWAIFAGFGICIAYNEDLTDVPPQHWIDLLNDKWKGRIGLEDINTAGSQYGQYYMLREILGKEFWEQLLSTQEPKIYYKTTDLANALLEGEIDIAGEFSIHTVYNYRVKNGTPIQGIYPEEGIPFVVNLVAILDQTNRPEEAKIFLNFLLSRRGQEIMHNSNYKYSLQDGVTLLEGIPSLNDLNILLPENAVEYARKRSEYIQEFNTFLGSNK